MSKSIDALDRQIIAILQRDGRTPNVEIARQLGVAEGTVRRRIERLVQEGIIKIAAVANPFKIGLGTVALIHVDVELPKVKEVAEKLVHMQEVRYVAYATGGHDIIIEAIFPSNQKLLEFLRDKLSPIPGIRQLETSIQLEILKRSYEWEIPNVDEDKPLATSKAERGKGVITTWPETSSRKERGEGKRRAKKKRRYSL